ncbi:AP-3 complex subunit delta-1 [[Emmonsia] crescens]|uniref:AP-3 complex subunit delta n=1 Tax=[Emmonsia] crescens TaxID=73230 RepID=A0A2B7ZG45_9EURO|nr:AP-3 complex subunit delta-1 [Emmonsia crescens]
MFGYDMSWAAFHVLEVMSSAKYPQKRVGYLGAVQSFRPDTEVLMLATNLLKKDMVSPIVPTMSLPLLTLPHIISPSLALSLLTDVLPRLSHSHPAVRKKAVVNLYRLSLVYPEAFRIAWPKIKERLMDDQEDSSVTAAVINVVCELGWRRPQDFLPLAPRLFDLLVDGGNNWMAIKIIKLFATLTPLEPRLVRKLLRPLTNIIQTTTAMSLLYECINGVIQGGILDGAEGVREGEEIANLCVEKLRGMIVMEGDPNLKYVALLAFNRIVSSHPTLVAMQQDVIMDCLDDNDISIRLQALELVSGMVSSDSLRAVVNRLITQLQTSPVTTDDVQVNSSMPVGLTPSADIDGDDPEEQLQSTNKRNESVFGLPNHYRNEVLHRILDICSRDTYSSIVDFEWYVEVLVQLVRLVPPPSGAGSSEPQYQKGDVAVRIGFELRNVAVRVKSVRPEATRAAESLILIDNRGTLFPAASAAGTDILESIAWIVGEYAKYLEVPDRTLTSLIHPSNLSLSGTVLSSYLQAIPKLFVSLTSKSYGWGSSRQSEVSLLLARIIDFLQKLSSHPDLDVQERAIEFLELLRLTADAISSQGPDSTDAPLLLSSAIPSLFTGLELNPVAIGAQKKVPQPENLDLDKPLNDRLHYILKESENGWLGITDQDDFRDFYYVPDVVSTKQQIYTKESLTPNPIQPATSYQNMSEDFAESAEAKGRRRAERRDRNKDDPFYIRHDEGSSGTSTPFHQVLRTSNGEELDIDSIPIIDLAIESSKNTTPPPATEGERRPKKPRSKPKKVEILGDETIAIGDERAASSGGLTLATAMAEKPKIKRSLLEVDSSGLSSLSLEEGSGPGTSGSTALGLSIHDIARREAEEAEMAKAMQEIERLRLEMQRAAERVQAHGVPPEGTLVKRKKKRKDKGDTWVKAKAKTKTKKREGNDGDGDGGDDGSPASSTATASAAPGGTISEPATTGGEAGEGEVEVKPKKKKKASSSSKKKKDDAAAGSGAGTGAG